MSALTSDRAGDHLLHRVMAAHLETQPVNSAVWASALESPAAVLPPAPASGPQLLRPGGALQAQEPRRADLN